MMMHQIKNLYESGEQKLKAQVYSVVFVLLSTV